MRVDSLADLPETIRNQAAGKIFGAAKNKYGNTPCQVRGIRFQSIKEKDRYLELMQALREGAIYDLRLQEEYILQPAYTTPEGVRIRAIKYLADFTYKVHRTEHMPMISRRDMDAWRALPEGAKVIEDAKGCRTDQYKIKRKMMANLGYEIREV